MLRTKQILQMLSNGVPQKQICADVHCSKRLVSAHKKKVEDTGSYSLVFMVASCMYLLAWLFLKIFTPKV